jgi:hypothetical protein
MEMACRIWGRKVVADCEGHDENLWETMTVDQRFCPLVHYLQDLEAPRGVPYSSFVLFTCFLDAPIFRAFQ